MLAIRLPSIPDTIQTDDAGPVAELRGAFPATAITHTDPADWPIDLDSMFEVALAPTVALPGGAIHIAETRAAVLIDVDTGMPDTGSAGRTLMTTNLAAVAAIAGQIRLRQIGGGIVIDFAGIEGRGPRERIRDAMAAALTGDPAQPQCLGWTRLNHLELVRPRRGRPLSDAMLEPLSVSKSALALAFEALRTLHREARAQPAANWRIAAAPAVVTALRGLAAAALHGLEIRLGRTIEIAEQPTRNATAFDIQPR
jgi:ribonuclease G